MLSDRTGLITPMLIAVFLHELGHLVVMKYFGCAPNEIRLIPGSIRIISPVCAEKNAIIISLSGPVVNILIFVIVYISSLILSIEYYIDFAFINLVYGIFNLLPFYSLDGGSILEDIIGVKKGGISARKIVKIITLIGASLFLIVFTFLAVKGNVNYSVLLLSLYLILSVFIKL
jgi:Zn-dependent protease